MDIIYINEGFSPPTSSPPSLPHLLDAAAMGGWHGAKLLPNDARIGTKISPTN